MIISCDTNDYKTTISDSYNAPNILNYSITPDNKYDRSSLVFSDQGAWFAYGIPTLSENYGGFSGPYLLTQDNGIWCSKTLSQLHLTDMNTNLSFDWTTFSMKYNAFPSHLEQVYSNGILKISQKLFFTTPHTVLIISEITNLSDKKLTLKPQWNGSIILRSLHLQHSLYGVSILSDNSTAIGDINIIGDGISCIDIDSMNYNIMLDNITIEPGALKVLLLSQTFIFPQYDIAKERNNVRDLVVTYQNELQQRIQEKESQLGAIYEKMDEDLSDSIYRKLIVKAFLTLQNNWRIPAGELKHSGLFPSYHYEWFNGMWAWDSWKHTAALSLFNPELAKDQIRVMYDFMDENGFIADCIYRDTAIENHNLRNTKPPLSAWAVWKIFKNDNDADFLREIYPKLLTQHRWWYTNRDHDNDGICEYGSTDGTLIAAKWESGMDNAVRFDSSNILQNSETAYSLDQESVDLNSYLYAEKIYLAEISKALQFKDEAAAFKSDAEVLKNQIQLQFFDSETGWFYDTSIDGENFIDGMGCEGWIPLWANVAKMDQAEAVKNNMMNPALFYTKVPFQTLSANHSKFKPDGGYWRGPNWIDQSYFGVIGLRNYGYNKEADDARLKIIHNADGVLEKGKSIRENYNPITGEGLESENFSWSAAHYILLLIDE